MSVRGYVLPVLGTPIETLRDEGFVQPCVPDPTKEDRELCARKHMKRAAVLALMTKAHRVVAYVVLDKRIGPACDAVVMSDSEVVVKMCRGSMLVHDVRIKDADRQLLEMGCTG